VLVQAAVLRYGQPDQLGWVGFRGDLPGEAGHGGFLVDQVGGRA
jgi:hypothetical protein